MSFKVYIAGPMRGYPELNKHEFNYAEEVLRSKKLYTEIINPIRLDEESGLDPEDLQTKDGLRKVMIRDLTELANCDVVYLLRGWEKSEGAKIEHLLATMLSLCIVYQ
jgi:hypothetical protein